MLSHIEYAKSVLFRESQELKIALLTNVLSLSCNPSDLGTLGNPFFCPPCIIKCQWFPNKLSATIVASSGERTIAAESLCVCVGRGGGGRRTLTFYYSW